MKEHRTKALRVTTPHSIENSSAGTKDEYMGRENANDLFGTLQILQFDWAPSRSNSPQSQNSFTAESDQSSSSHYSQPSAASEMMTTHTASFTANAAAFGKHDSFYRWFSSDFENHRQNSEEIRQYSSTDQDPNCCKCERDLKYNTTTCHCRSSFSKRKIKEKKFTSTCAIRSSLASFHAEHSYTIWDLISGNVSENWFLKVRDIKEAISREKAVCSKSEWYKLRDANGNTVLLVSGQKLLREGCFDKAVELVKLFLDEGADVNVINNENRTLLSYSVQYMDKSIRLTTLLINYGATVWPIPAEAAQLPLCSNSINSQKYGNGSNCNSAFTWFLKSIIRQLKLSDHCLRTLYVLAEVMGENPKRMHSHVMNTMFNHAKCYSILGPVFLQIKLAMSPYWTQPQSLKFLCKSVIRKSIIDVPGRCINAENISSLMLPPSLQSYLMLEY